VARKPLIHGTQTAVVTGKSGEEIWTDKLGRVKVQFFWDRLGKADENSSCWIRVAQGWAGKGFGAFFLPRMGHEVVVSFLEGDPDRPLITGSVHNAETTPPYALPGEQTKSTLKTLSSKGGGGFNEFRFEDNKGKEEIFLHAEKDQQIRVKDSVFETIGGERHLEITKDQFEEVKGDLHLHTVGDVNQKVDGTVSLNAGMNIQDKAGMNYAMDAGSEIHLKAGMTVVMEAGVSLTIKVGGNFINLNPAGVFISGSMVFINSGGSAGSGSGSSPQAPTAPKEAVDSEAGSATTAEAPPALTKATFPSATGLTLTHAAKSGAPFCEVPSDPPKGEDAE
jgi:type VI secretion system secreted protein VgrG